MEPERNTHPSRHSSDVSWTMMHRVSDLADQHSRHRPQSEAQINAATNKLMNEIATHLSTAS